MLSLMERERWVRSGSWARVAVWIALSWCVPVVLAGCAAGIDQHGSSSSSSGNGGGAGATGGSGGAGATGGSGGAGATGGSGGAGGAVVMIYANYDGGTFTINVDSSEPNIKIGLDSYEAMHVTLQGPGVSHVSEVLYAGYDDVPGSVISGVNPTIVTILKAPAATVSDPNGYPSIICNYSGGSGNQGGCNTKAQIQAYFSTTLAAPIAFHNCQYGVYSGTLSTSAGGTCN